MGVWIMYQNNIRLNWSDGRRGRKKERERIKGWSGVGRLRKDGSKNAGGGESS